MSIIEGNNLSTLMSWMEKEDFSITWRAQEPLMLSALDSHVLSRKIILFIIEIVKWISASCVVVCVANFPLHPLTRRVRNGEMKWRVSCKREASTEWKINIDDSCRWLNGREMCWQELRGLAVHLKCEQHGKLGRGSRAKRVMKAGSERSSPTLYTTSSIFLTPAISALKG